MMLRIKMKNGCDCFRERQSRWVEPSILLLLWDQSRHGYELMMDLPTIGFVKNSIDPGAVYRTLRHLEEAELVTSEWDTEGPGPAKRQYTITELGKNHLQLWADSMKQRRDAIDAFVEKVDNFNKNINK